MQTDNKKVNLITSQCSVSGVGRWVWSVELNERVYEVKTNSKTVIFDGEFWDTNSIMPSSDGEHDFYIELGEYSSMVEPDDEAARTVRD